MPDIPKDDEYVTLIETIAEDGDFVIHQWRTEDGTLVEEYIGAKKVFLAEDFWDNMYESLNNG